MELKDVYKVEITGLDHNGRGISKINNKVIFIEDALIGEVVDVEITHIKKDFLEGEVINYYEKSDFRVSPVCLYAKICGGCDIMHMPYFKQLEYKENKVKNIMSKYLKMDGIVNPIVGSENEVNYRNKLTLQVNEVIGLYKKKTYEIIKIENCQLVDKKINNILFEINKIGKFTNIDKIIIRTSNINSMVILDQKNYINNKPWIELGKTKNISIISKYNSKYEVLHGDSYINEYLNDYKFKISPSAFFQINIKQTINLYNKIKSLLENNDKVLDLYCGIGSIGIYVSDKVKELVGVEINEESVKNAEENKQVNNVNCAKFYSGDVEKVINKIKFKPNIIIVDPPRSGLSLKTVDSLLKINADKIIYVSCDPITLARDLNKLKIKYNIAFITPYDMFPNTSHVECVVLLTKKKSA